MSAGVATLLAVVLVAIPVLVGIAVSRVVDTATDKGSKAYSGRQRSHAGFTTSLAPAEIDAAVAEAAAMMPGARAGADGQGRTTVAFRPGSGVVITVAAGAPGPNRVRFSPLAGGTADADLVRFRGCMLAALRTRDPETRYR